MVTGLFLPLSRPTTQSMSTPYGIKCTVHLYPEDSIIVSVHQRGIYTHITASSRAMAGEATRSATPTKHQEWKQPN